MPDYLTTLADNYANTANISAIDGSVADDTLVAYKGFGAFWQETAKEFVDWTVVVFSIERLLVAVRPLSAALARTDAIAWRRTLAKEGCIFILAMLFSLSYLVTYYYFYAYFRDSTLNYQDSLTPSLRRWYHWQIGAETVLCFAKWILLLIFDSALVVVLWKHRVAINVSVKMSKRCSTRNANIIVLASLTVYTLTQLPYVILECLKMASREPFNSLSLTNEQLSHAGLFVGILQWSNYSVTFFVYFLSSPKFRRQCRVLWGSVADPALEAKNSLSRLFTVVHITGIPHSSDTKRIPKWYQLFRRSGKCDRPGFEL
ncbi:uncharacterized protein LOC129595401 isoform X3 [Paramacrobiotus metropolitanus]|nr:uncharacterized protein LOC129595401 isoform X3 [Paramacrobiotus metropolitanus]